MAFPNTSELHYREQLNFRKVYNFFKIDRRLLNVSFAVLIRINRVFPKIDHSGNVARIVLDLKYVFLNI